MTKDFWNDPIQELVALQEQQPKSRAAEALKLTDLSFVGATLGTITDTIFSTGGNTLLDYAQQFRKTWQSSHQEPVPTHIEVTLAEHKSGKGSVPFDNLSLRIPLRITEEEPRKLARSPIITIQRSGAKRIYKPVLLETGQDPTYSQFCIPNYDYLQGRIDVADRVLRLQDIKTRLQTLKDTRSCPIAWFSATQDSFPEPSVDEMLENNLHSYYEYALYDLLITTAQSNKEDLPARLVTRIAKHPHLTSFTPDIAKKAISQSLKNAFPPKPIQRKRW